jgi:AcrR family transcriptional regulator
MPVSKKGARRATGKPDTKRLIVEKATDLFYEHGFVAGSIRDIARAVGVTNAAIYIHFKDKDEILYTIIEEIGSNLVKVLRDATRGCTDPLDYLTRMIRAQVCLIKEKRKQIKIYMEEQYQLSDRLRKKAYKQHRKIYHLYYDKVCEIKKMNLLRDVDETVVSFSIFAIMNWSYRWYHDGGRMSIEDIAEDIIRIILGGILADDSRA